jgi:hypothetical protein
VISFPTEVFESRNLLVVNSRIVFLKLFVIIYQVLMLNLSEATFN